MDLDIFWILKYKKLFCNHAFILRLKYTECLDLMEIVVMKPTTYKYN